MIFASEMAKLVRAGKKTQTRRRTCRYAPGHSYAIQSGRGKPGNGRLTVLEVRQEPLGSISLRDARREGFRTTSEFKDYWMGLHGSWNPYQLIYVISFVLGDHTDAPRFLAAKPGLPHGDYVQSGARALRGTNEEVSASVQRRYTLAVEKARESGEAQHRERLLAAIGAIRLEAAKQNAGSAISRKRLKSVEHQLRAYDREMRRTA